MRGKKRSFLNSPKRLKFDIIGNVRIVNIRVFITPVTYLHNVLRKFSKVVLSGAKKRHIVN